MRRTKASGEKRRREEKKKRKEKKRKEKKRRVERQKFSLVAFSSSSLSSLFGGALQIFRHNPFERLRLKRMPVARGPSRHQLYRGNPYTVHPGLDTCVVVVLCRLV
jgi:hypothetical protein